MKFLQNILESIYNNVDALSAFMAIAASVAIVMWGAHYGDKEY